MRSSIRQRAHTCTSIHDDTLPRQTTSEVRYVTTSMRLFFCFKQFAQPCYGERPMNRKVPAHICTVHGRRMKYFQNMSTIVLIHSRMNPNHVFVHVSVRISCGRLFSMLIGMRDPNVVSRELNLFGFVTNSEQASHLLWG